MIFLAGLSKNINEVQGQLLGIKPLPPIKEIFAEVWKEKSRRRVMLGMQAPSMEESVLIVWSKRDKEKQKSTKIGVNIAKENPIILRTLVRSCMASP